MLDNFTYRNQVILAHHLCFNSIECRLSFLDDNRLHKDYKKHIFPFMCNMLKPADLKATAEKAMIHMVDVIAMYAEKIAAFYPDNDPKQRRLMEIVSQKAKVAVSDGPASVVSYAQRVAEIDGLKNDCAFDAFDFEKEFPYWPSDMREKLGLLGAAYADFNSVTRAIEAKLETGKTKFKKPTMATSIQLMVAPRDFMAHIGTAFQYGLRRDAAKNKPELVRKNIKNAENHLHHLIFDFIKSTTLMAFHYDQSLAKSSITSQHKLDLLAARHYEYTMIGKDFLDRYALLRKTMLGIVAAVMPDVKMSNVELEDV